MKKLLFLLLSAWLYVPVIAQTLTIRFEGTRNANAKNYAVDLDGTWYYSTNANESGNRGIRQIVIDNASIGQHKIQVYEMNSQTVNTSTDEMIYSNTFRLRNGYDMTIAVRRNGSVAFTEKKAKATTATTSTVSGGAAMSDATFTSLHNSIKSKWSQSSRVSAIKTAIANKSYNFSTEQLGQLLLLVTSEENRLTLAKLAYPKVTDPANFYDMAQLFTTQANKDVILSYSRNSGSLVTTNEYASRIAMSDDEFSNLQSKARLHFRQSSTVADIRAAFSNKSNYFTTEQIRSLLSLVSSEANRLMLAKLAYHRAADPTTFTQLYDLFSTQASINELNSYIKNNPS